jgi:hypothetical protein
MFNPANLAQLQAADGVAAYFTYSTSDTTGTVQSTQNYFDGAVGLLRKGDVIRVAGSDATKMYRVGTGVPDVSLQLLETL